jgi:hypothetical protein
MANGTAIDARKESKLLQDLILAENKRCKIKKQKAEVGESSMVLTTKKSRKVGSKTKNLPRQP